MTSISPQTPRGTTSAGRVWRPLLRTIVATALAILAGAASAERADACRCQPQALASYYEAADIVALGEILAVTTIARENATRAFRSAEIRLLEAVKGATGLGTVRTPLSSAACGISIHPGERYWIFAKRQLGESHVWIDSCNGSRRSDRDFSDVAAAAVAAHLRALAAAGATVVEPTPFTDPNCWTQPRRWHTGKLPAEIAQRITIEKTERSAVDAEGVVSPNSAYRLFVRNPPPAGRPPHVGNVTIEAERDYPLQLRLHGIAAPLQARWINEKLVLVNVAWDEDLFADLILDVEGEKLIYAESVRSGEPLFDRNRGPCNSY